jgi:hypothetical protein
MRTARTMMSAVGVLLLAGFGAAQSTDDDLSSLRHGHLVVWVLRSDTVNNTPAAAAADGSQQPGQPAGPPGYAEKTVAELGQPASTFGHDAGSYGLPSDTTKISTAQAPPGADAPVAASDAAGYHEQTSGSFGQPSSDYGKVSSEYGHTAGSVGQTAGSYGQTAGSYGQTAGSLGNSLSTIADAARPKQPRLDWQSKWKKDLQTKFPQLRVDYVDVDASDLRGNLRLYENKPGYPDVLMGQLPATWKPETTSRYLTSVTGAEAPNSIGVQASSSQVSMFFPPAFVLARARHMPVAQAFVMWLGDDEQRTVDALRKQ